MPEEWQHCLIPWILTSHLPPGIFQSSFPSPQQGPLSLSEALGLFGETPPPPHTPLLPGNSCGWMRSWEPGHRGVRPRKGGRGREVGFKGVSRGT